MVAARHHHLSLFEVKIRLSKLAQFTVTEPCMQGHKKHGVPLRVIPRGLQKSVRFVEIQKVKISFFSLRHLEAGTTRYYLASLGVFETFGQDAQYIADRFVAFPLTVLAYQ